MIRPGPALALSAGFWVAVALLGAAVAHGEERPPEKCGPLPVIEARIAGWGETLLLTATSNITHATSRVYVSQDKGSYTAIVVRGERACFVDEGVALLGSRMPAVGERS